METILPGKIEKILKLLAKQYQASDEKIYLEIVVNGKYEIEEQTESDNWNGGVAGHTIHFTLNEAIFTRVLKAKEKIGKKLVADINNIKTMDNEYIAKVDFDISDDEYEDDWREKTSVFSSENARPIHKEDSERIWNVGGFRVFISHKVNKKTEASMLKNNLKPFGISGFVAHEDIEPTQEWQNEIEKALHSMDLFIALISEDFHDSQWTDQEIGFALGRRIPIVPINIGKNPYGFIGKIQALKGTDGYYKEILRTLYESKQLQDKMISCFAEALRLSGSFANSENMLEMMKYFPELKDEQRTLLIQAFNENGQVNGCWAFNGKRIGIQNSQFFGALNKGSKTTYTIFEDKISVDFG